MMRGTCVHLNRVSSCIEYIARDHVARDQNGDERPKITINIGNPVHSNIEILDLERVILDVLAPGFDLLAHEE